MAIDTGTDGGAGPGTVGAAGVREAVAELARGFAGERRERQQRTELDPADLDALAAAGLLRTGLPAERGGLWGDLASTSRGICEIWRVLARGDSSLALTTSMHPAVLAFWLATPEVPEPHAGGWRRQREAVFDGVEQGAWWGTITSEPGSGGDVARSRTVAVRASGDASDGAAGDRSGGGVSDGSGGRASGGPAGGGVSDGPGGRAGGGGGRDGGGGEEGWRITGQKHFGSGTGVASYMLTTAVPEGEDEPDWFYVPVAGNPLDGSQGVSLVAAWDGHGMAATQSHALAFEGAAAVRFAWPGHLNDLIGGAAPFIATLFTAVVLGIVEEAVETARQQLAPRAEGMRAYEQVEWAQAELEAWTMAQVYEGALRAIESGRPARGAALRAKTAGAQLAESCLGRLCRVLGGGTFSRRSPFGHWFEDVRALGFLRPPWGLAFDGLIVDSWEPTTG